MIYEKTNNFFVQKINIAKTEQSRIDFFKALCKNKNVLHVGCADAMRFSADNNLHILLSKTAKQLFGYDIEILELNKLKDICVGTYFSSINECREYKYDIIIVPEVLEHTFNAKDFLDEIFSLDSNEFFISVPSIIHYSKEMLFDENIFTEIVHPDHKYWFSPYTLYNIVKPYIKDEQKCKMYYLENESMVAIHIIK